MEPKTKKVNTVLEECREVVNNLNDTLFENDDIIDYLLSKSKISLQSIDSFVTYIDEYGIKIKNIIKDEYFFSLEETLSFGWVYFVKSIKTRKLAEDIEISSDSMDLIEKNTITICRNMFALNQYFSKKFSNYFDIKNSTMYFYYDFDDDKFILSDNFHKLSIDNYNGIDEEIKIIPVPYKIIPVPYNGFR